MRFVCRLALSLVLSLSAASFALAQSGQPDAGMTEQGGAVRAMGSVRPKRSVESGIEIPDYGGNISAIRRLPLGTTSPRSWTFIPVRRIYYPVDAR